MAARVWTTGRKWPGNLIPILFAAPFVTIGVLLMVRANGITPLGVGLCAAGLTLGWLAINFFGLFGNAKLKAEIARKMLAKAGKNASAGAFVGFARPSYVGLLDAHEDLGFLFLEGHRLEFLGELHHVTLDRNEVLGVRFRGNVHSLLGLGRWVSIEATVKGKPIRVLIEPREAPTLLGNRKKGTELRNRIEEWRRARRAK